MIVPIVNVFTVLISVSLVLALFRGVKQEPGAEVGMVEACVCSIVVCHFWLPVSSEGHPAKDGTSCRPRLRVAQAVTAILQPGASVSTSDDGVNDKLCSSGE